MLVAKKFIYCWWLALWAFLFYVNLVPISPLFSWTFAAIFTTTAIVFFNTSKRMSITLKLIFVATELIILYAVYSKKPKFTRRDVISNLVIFGIYLAFLGYNNLDFYTVYFKMLPPTYKDITTSSYIQTRIKEFI